MYNSIYGILSQVAWHVIMMKDVTHMPKDRPEIVDPRILALLAFTLRDLLSALNSDWL